VAELLSLKALKAENAAKEEAAKNLPVDDKTEIIKDEYVEVDETNAPVIDEESASNEATDDDTVIESWMQTEEAETSDDDLKTGFVPNEAAANRRRKGKALKGELKEVKSENEVLLARISALESGTAPQAEVKEALPSRPTREQHDFDDDAYDAAIDEWNDKRFDLKLKSHAQTSQQETNQTQQLQAAQETQDKHVGDHYERAQKLVDEGRITTESYQGADKLVRLTVENIFPGRGDMITNGLISTLNSLGEGSEKVLYQLGVNPTVMSKFQSLLMTDKSGMAVAAYLGKLQADISTPKKRRSQAPNPGSRVEGEGGGGGKDGSLQKQYNKIDSGNIQARISFKRKAKKSGTDTRNW